MAECALAGGLDKGTAGDRYQVVVHVDADTLAAGASDGEPSADGAAMAHSNPSASDTAAGDGSGTDAARDAGGRPPGPDVPAGTSGPGSAAASGADAPSPAAVGAVVPAAASGQSALDEAGGIHVSGETARRMACDAAKVTMRHGPAGEVLSVGRRTRTISPALRRALAARDRHCRFPGCQATRCDSHHVRHWAHGGETTLSNLVLLCRRHHRAVHEEGFRVGFDAAGESRFVRPDGRALPAAPGVTGPALASVTARLDREGIRPGPHTATPAWRGERLDVDWAVGVLWRPRGGTPPSASPAA